MSKNCCPFFVVCFVIFINIAGGIHGLYVACLTTDTYTDTNISIANSSICRGILFLISGAILFFGAIERKPRWILAHVYLNGMLLVLGAVAVSILSITEHLSYSIMAFLVCMLLFSALLEYGIYAYYKQLVSDEKHEDRIAIIKKNLFESEKHII